MIVKGTPASTSTTATTCTPRSTSRRSPYNLPRRREALKEIRRLIIEEGLSHNEIQLKLNLPPTTYFRYLDVLFESERDIIARNTTEIEVLNESIILREKFLRRSRKLEEIINDSKVDAHAKIQAHHLAAELDKAAHIIYYEAPSALASRRARLLSSSSLPSLPSSLDEAYRLEYEKEMKKKKQQQQQQQQKEEYDELDYPDDEDEVENAQNSYGFH